MSPSFVPSRVRRSRRALATSFVAVLLLACGGAELLTGPDVPLPTEQVPVIPFPDSITTTHGLPPLAGATTSRLLPPDTLVRTEMLLSPVYQAGQAMQIGLRVFATDTSTSAFHGRTLPLAVCPFVIRLHRSSNPTSAPVWQSDRAATALRCPTLLTFNTGGTDVHTSWDVSAILGDSLPSGKYAFSYAVRTADGRLLEFTHGAEYLTADRSLPSTDLSALAWTARSQVVGLGPRTLTTTVTLKNTGSHVLALSSGACDVNVRLFRTSTRSGPPVWLSEARLPARGSGGYSCIGILYVTHVAPGDSLVLPVSYPMYEVLGDSLPAGRYYASAELWVSGGDGSNASGGTRVSHTVAAGAVDLTRGPDRLPSSRVVDSLSFTATTRTIRGTGGADTIRTLVLVTNTSSVRREADVAGDCPVIVYAYRSAALRDSVPMQFPVAYPDAQCYLTPHHFALDPGQSWVFGRDVAMSSARAALGVGHLWFTAWLPGRPNVIIAAGDADVH